MISGFIPALVDALQDRTLRGHAREVYLWFYQNMDLVEFRPVKHSVIEVALGINSMSVARAVDRLLAAGYLDRGPRDGKLWLYRLYFSRSPRPEGAVVNTSPPEM
jgi:hypothetical protein